MGDIRVLVDPDPDAFLSAIGRVAEALGMSSIGARTGLRRESLCKSFGPEAKPRVDTVLKVLRSLEVKLQITA